MRCGRDGDASASSSGARLRCLEAGRGVAALVVVFRHACVHAFEGPQGVAFIPVPSATAVLFFFMLSGAVMALSHADHGHPWLEAWRFLLQRALRIYPLYWTVLLATLMTWPFLVKESLLAGWVFLVPSVLPPSDLQMLIPIPPAWTLHWEVFFYGMFLAHIVLGARSRVLWAWGAAILVAQVPAAGRALSGHLGALDTLGRLVTADLGLFFLAGVAVARTAARRRPRAPAAAALAFAGVGLTGVSIWQGTAGVFLPHDFLGTLLAVCGLAALLLGLIWLERSRALRLGRGSILLGQVSFPLYLSHWLFMDLTFRGFTEAGVDVGQHPYWFFAALLAASLAGGLGVAGLVDQPLQRLARTLVPRREAPAGA